MKKNPKGDSETNIEKIKRFGKMFSGSATIGVEGLVSGTVNIDPKKAQRPQNEAENFLKTKMPTLQEGIDLIESLKKDIDLGLPKKLKLVVFIDDLDRCSLPKALEVLEFVKILLGIEGIVYVVGISDRTISRLIDIQYNDTGIKGEEYIKKIIQVKYQLRAWTPNGIPDIIEKNVLKELGKNAPDFLTN